MTTQTTPQNTIKQITKASDLENLKLLDNIELSHYLSLPIDRPQYMQKGLFGGSFQINNDKYLMLTKVKHYPEAYWADFVTSILYKAHEDTIVYCGGILVDDYPVGETSLLEEKINNHLTSFKELKLEKLRQMNSK
jgi:hypothetical protein